MNKQTEKTTVIAILVILALLVFVGGSVKPAPNEQGVGGTNVVTNFINNVKDLIFGSDDNTGFDENTDMISLKMYDKDGNLVTPVKGTYSIVQGTPGVSNITVTITLENLGTKVLTCNLGTLLPTAFNTAVTKSSKNLMPGGKISWTSGYINVPPLELLAQPVIFTAPVTCTYNQGVSIITLPVKTGTLPVTITSDSVNASFSVGVDLGGLSPEVCGDGTCTVSEDAINCPDDCAIASYVKFRTSDNTYSGGAIAYTNGTCGTTLEDYGFIGYVSSTGTSCSACTYVGKGTQILSSLPKSAVYTSAELWSYVGYTTGQRLIVCYVDAGKCYFKRYENGDPDQIAVSKLATAENNPAIELAC